MKFKIADLGILFLFVVFSFNCSKEKGSPDSYLGQIPPGPALEVFAPGIITTDKSESSVAVSPDLNEIYFIRKSPKESDNQIWFSKVENGKLTDPQIVPFAYDCIEGYPCFTPDGKRLYYVSGRPAPGLDTTSYWGSIWFVDRDKEGWSEPKHLDSSINDLSPHFMTMDKKGTLYFGCGLRSVYYAEWSDGKFSEAVKLPDEINCFESVSHPAISPDGSYLMVDVYWTENDSVKGSLFISFKRPDGSWTKVVDMRDALKINDSHIWCSATVTPDGKYIFVERFILGESKSDMFWVSAEIIEDLKPEELK